MTEDIGNFFNNVTDKNFSEAEKQFSDIINARLADRLESEKAMIANQVYNGITDDELEMEDEVELYSETEELESEAQAEDEDI